MDVVICPPVLLAANRELKHPRNWLRGDVKEMVISGGKIRFDLGEIAAEFCFTPKCSEKLA